MYVYFQWRQFGPETLRCRLSPSPCPQVANCQSNSIFHLAKRISELLSHVCEGCMQVWQMLDLATRTKVLHAGYTTPRTHARIGRSVQFLERHRDACVFLIWRQRPLQKDHPVHPRGQTLSCIWKWMQDYTFQKKKKGKRFKLMSQCFSEITYLDFEEKGYNSCSGLFLWRRPLLWAEGVVPAPGLVSWGWWGWFQPSCWDLDRSWARRWSL